MTIIIALVTACGLLIFVLCLAVLLAWRRLRSRQIKQKYYQRTEAQHMLQVGQHEGLREAGDGAREPTLEKIQRSNSLMEQQTLQILQHDDTLRDHSPQGSISQLRMNAGTPPLSTFQSPESSPRKTISPKHSAVPPQNINISPTRRTTSPVHRTTAPPQTIVGGIRPYDSLKDRPFHHNNINFVRNNVPVRAYPVLEYQSQPSQVKRVIADDVTNHPCHPGLPDWSQNHKSPAPGVDSIRPEQDGESSCSGHTSSADSGRGPSDVELHPRPSVYPGYFLKPVASVSSSESSESSEAESEYCSSSSDLSSEADLPVTMTTNMYSHPPRPVTLTTSSLPPGSIYTHAQGYITHAQDADLDAISEESEDCFI